MPSLQTILDVKGFVLSTQRREIEEHLEGIVSDQLTKGPRYHQSVADTRPLFCPEYLDSNGTLLIFFNAIDRCPAPAFKLRHIRPQHVIWTESEEGAAEDKQEAGTFARKPARNEVAQAPAPATKGKKVYNPNDSYIVFCMMSEDYFSYELEGALLSVAPAYPDVFFVKADGEEFARFTKQYNVRTLPRLLLFNSGKLISQYRGKREAPALALWLTQNVHTLPRTVIPIARRPLSGPAYWSEPLLWVAVVYFVFNVSFICIRVSKRWRERRRDHNHHSDR